MRLIDADAFENYVYDEWIKNEISNGDWIQFREWLKDQDSIVEFDGKINEVIVKGEKYYKPTIDAVPVVRCRECKYMTEHYDTDGNSPYWTCSEWDSGTDYDGYCHYGERKDGDGDG